MYWITTHFEIVLVIVFALGAAIVVLQQRRTPQSAAAWLLSIIVLPWVAVPLFLALGFRKRGREFHPIAFSELEPAQDVPDRHGPDVLLRSLGLPPATDGNRFDLLRTPEDAFKGVMALVEGATESLDVLFYIVADDTVGEAFVEALEAKARAGVRVRLLLDRLGTFGRSGHSLDRLIKAGGKVRYFSPFLQPRSAGHLNLRNHRKMVIADGCRVFSGGMNVGDDYMGPEAGAARWCDLAYLLEGPAVLTFRDVFRSDWAVTGGENAVQRPMIVPKAAGEARVQVVATGPDLHSDPLHDALVHAIHVATDRIWIVTPYFLPTEILSHALTCAARRGIDVRIILPQRSNQRVADFARGAYLWEMHQAGCQVLFFQGGMIHAKAGIIDDAAFVGSANFDVRSMLLNFEIVLFVYDAVSVDELAAWFARREQNCRAGVRRAGMSRRVLEGVFRLGAPIL